MKEEEQFHSMEEIKNKLAVVSEVIAPGSKVVYLDYPVHGNIGDLLIMKGTEAFFRDYGITVRKRYSYINFRTDAVIPEDWIVVCHGGGNFGDLYPHHQQLREKAVKAFRRNRIVILPQTIHFADPLEEQRAFVKLSEHPDLHLFVRDETSYMKAKSKLTHVYLAPDMAHQLYPLPSNPPNNRRKLALLRTDKESSPRESSASFDHKADWPQLFSKWDRRLLKLILAGYSLDRLLKNKIPLRPVWYFLADKYIARAMALFDQYDRILTSRLHGHILSCLMDKPNLLLDNSYGKNKSYSRLWTYRLEEESFNDKPGGNHSGGLYPQSS